MTAEPYICKKGPRAGEIEWFEDKNPPEASVKLYMDNGEIWQRFCDFENDKLIELCGFLILKRGGHQITLLRNGKRMIYVSSQLIGYSYDQYLADTESNRVLTRYKFLKAVCEKEGIMFLPQENHTSDMKKCCIEGCENEGANGRGNHCWKHYHRIRKYGDPDTVGHQWKIESLADHAGIKRMIEEKVAVNLETGCWEWTGARHKQGYGKQTIKRSEQQVFPAHRLAAMVYLGFSIDSEELVCHKCDNPPCCNPEHLFIGDWKANADDMVAKGRAVDVSDRERSAGGTFLPKAV